jgi:DNA-directed RNA polymerase specialized sigma24 family protein
MPDSGSVTLWIELFKAGDAVAAERLWEQYYRRLVGLARQRLGSVPPSVVDDEDVALSVLDSFYRGVEAGRFPRLADRGDLWQVLVMLTARKAWRRIRHEQRDKRDWRRTEPTLDAEEEGAVEIIGREPTPEFAVLVADEFQRLLDRLGDDTLRSVALWKMEGHTVEEIAARLKVVPRTVERRLALIRTQWAQESQP